MTKERSRRVDYRYLNSNWFYFFFRGATILGLGGQTGHGLSLVPTQVSDPKLSTDGDRTAHEHNRPHSSPPATRLARKALNGVLILTTRQKGPEEP